MNGEKAAWISNGTIATHALVHLSVERTKGIARTGIAFIPLDLPGVSKGEPLDKPGQRALNQGSMRFRDARASLIEYGVNDILALVGARRLIERSAS